MINWPLIGYISMQVMQIIFAFYEGHLGFGLAVLFWSLGNVIAYLSK